MAPLPLRGEVWDVRFPQPIGDHPAIVASVNELCARLGAITVVLVTGTPGPEQTHLPLGADAGLDRYAESYANVTDLHTMPKGRFRRRRGLLGRAEQERLDAALTLALGLHAPS